MPDDKLTEAIEWATRVVAISDQHGQSCHEYEFAARALIALHEENERLRELVKALPRNDLVLAEHRRETIERLESELRVANAEIRTWKTATDALREHTRKAEAERDAVEQVTAEAIAEWLGRPPRDERAAGIATAIRSGAWRKP